MFFTNTFTNEVKTAVMQFHKDEAFSTLDVTLKVYPFDYTVEKQKPVEKELLYMVKSGLLVNKRVDMSYGQWKYMFRRIGD